MRTCPLVLVSFTGRFTGRFTGIAAPTRAPGPWSACAVSPREPLLRAALVFSAVPGVSQEAQPCGLRCRPRVAFEHLEHTWLM